MSGRAWETGQATASEPAPPRPSDRRSILPAGTVTFLVADLDPAAPGGPPAERLRRLVADCLTAHDGRLSEPGPPGPGGGSVAVFESAVEAVAAAVVHRGTAEPDLARSLRIALHTGEAQVREDGRYTGPAMRRCERLCEIGNGGQTLISAQAAAAVAGSAPAGSALRDLGVHRLRDLLSPARVFELAPAAMPTAMPAAPPPLRSLDTARNNLPV
jgi:class 3 adenylate cyclase